MREQQCSLAANYYNLYLVIPSFQRQRVGDGEPVPVDFKVGRFAVTMLD